MAFTKEQKKEARKRKKEEAINTSNQLGVKMIKTAPPVKLLKAPFKQKDLGKSTVDYGGHQKALNFPMLEGKGTMNLQQVQISMSGSWVEEDGPTLAPGSSNIYREVMEAMPSGRENKIGTLTIGLVYEGDWKADSRLAGKGQRQMCKISEQHLHFLFLVKEMLYPKLHPTLQPLVDETLRVNILCGAKTLAHTDSFRGNTPNFVYILQQPGVQPGYLCYDVFPVFKYSVVKLFGKYFIPHSFSQASNECKCIGEHPTKPNHPYFYVFLADVIDIMEPYGDLDFGVMGWTANGMIQVVPGYEDVCL